MTPDETRQFLERVEIIAHNLSTIIREGNPRDLDLDWQIGQMITTCENWSDQLEPKSQATPNL